MNSEIDMKEMIPLMEVEGEQSVSMIEQPETIKKIKLIQETKGVSKVTSKELEKGLYTFSFAFDNLGALNKCVNIMYSDSTNEITDFTYFALRDKNTLFFTMPSSGESSSEGEQSGATEETGMGGFTSEIHLKFPRKIASVNTKNEAKVSEDKTEIIYTFDMLEMSLSTFAPDMLIKLKKK